MCTEEHFRGSHPQTKHYRQLMTIRIQVINVSLGGAPPIYLPVLNGQFWKHMHTNNKNICVCIIIERKRLSAWGGMGRAWRRGWREKGKERWCKSIQLYIIYNSIIYDVNLSIYNVGYMYDIRLYIVYNIQAYVTILYINIFTSPLYSIYNRVIYHIHSYT